MPVVQLALEMPIRARPGAHHAEADAGGDHCGHERRSTTLTVHLDAPIDVVGVAEVVLGAGVTARLVRLVEVDQVAALKSRCRRFCWPGAEGRSAHTPRSAARQKPISHPQGSNDARSGGRAARVARRRAVMLSGMSTRPGAWLPQTPASHQGVTAGALSPQESGSSTASVPSTSLSCAADKIRSAVRGVRAPAALMAAEWVHNRL